MTTKAMLPPEMSVFLNHIYELKKGVRHMVLMTMHPAFEEFAVKRLEANHIAYHVQQVCPEKINLYFGKKECLDALRYIATKPVNLLTPEEDFILGTLLGYDVCMECERYCSRKEKSIKEIV